jgi:hypothetical protein
MAPRRKTLTILTPVQQSLRLSIIRFTVRSAAAFHLTLCMTRSVSSIFAGHVSRRDSLQQISVLGLDATKNFFLKNQLSSPNALMKLRNTSAWSKTVVQLSITMTASVTGRAATRRNQSAFSAAKTAKCTRVKMNICTTLRLSVKRFKWSVARARHGLRENFVKTTTASPFWSAQLTPKILRAWKTRWKKCSRKRMRISKHKKPAWSLIKMLVSKPKRFDTKQIPTLTRSKLKPCRMKFRVLKQNSSPRKKQSLWWGRSFRITWTRRNNLNRNSRLRQVLTLTHSLPAMFAPMPLKQRYELSSSKPGSQS